MTHITDNTLYPDSTQPHPEDEHGISLPIYFENTQWAVTAYGIECIDPYEYFIEKSRLCEKRPFTELPDWPIHLSEKTWVATDEFNDAIRKAIEVHGVTCFTKRQINEACRKGEKTEARRWHCRYSFPPSTTDTRTFAEKIDWNLETIKAARLQLTRDLIAELVTVEEVKQATDYLNDRESDFYWTHREKFGHANQPDPDADAAYEERYKSS